MLKPIYTYNGKKYDATIEYWIEETEQFLITFSRRDIEGRLVVNSKLVSYHEVTGWTWYDLATEYRNKYCSRVAQR